MAMTGRKPKPIEQRIKEGNQEKRPLPEPMLVAGRPDLQEIIEPPEDMPAAGKEAWARIVPTLAEVGLLDRVDSMAIEAMCIQWARMKQAGRVVAAQGHLVRGPGGSLREHPSLKTEREAARLFQSFAEQFALTPVARTRLGLAEVHRRSLKTEFDSSMGAPDLQPVLDV